MTDIPPAPRCQNIDCPGGGEAPAESQLPVIVASRANVPPRGGPFGLGGQGRATPVSIVAVGLCQACLAQATAAPTAV